MALLGSRHSARLRGAIVGKNKSDVIDADVLARAGDVFALGPIPVMTPPQLALRRAVTRRGAAVIDGNRYWRRLMFADPLGVPGRVDRLRWLAADSSRGVVPQSAPDIPSPGLSDVVG